ncbi:hypothetical protein [Methanococcus maripaludis]|uniref:Uncharacterized protein n=1 Tax=Methanococcus maripaludis TaxID=39152 RepID=A0A2L1C8G8_METMI|nr:hypothetical protein [Methanococcus maripaludis]AVB75644.1 hypothetical protein MMJJ_02250 [Methanococcus maripaludis]
MLGSQKNMSKTQIIFIGFGNICLTLVYWYILVFIVGQLDVAFYPLVNGYTTYMEWYPYIVLLVNYHPILIVLYCVAWMYFRGNEVDASRNVIY